MRRATSIRATGVLTTTVTRTTQGTVIATPAAEPIASCSADICTVEVHVARPETQSSTRRQIPAGATFAAESGARIREDMTMNTTMTMYSIAIAIAGAMTIGIASPTWAASVPSNTAAVATAARNAATDVRSYRDGYRRGQR